MIKKEEESSKFEIIKNDIENLLENFPLRKFIIFVFSIGLLIAILGIFIISLKSNQTCGDETSYNECSKNKPYFCEQGKLIEKASVCGCNTNLSINENSCISEYQLEGRETKIKYFLRGEEKEINITLYGKMAEYLSHLPYSISYKNGANLSRTNFKLRNINNEEQRNLLMPLVVAIQNINKDKIEQMRIAVSIVQKIPFESSNKTIFFGGNILNYSRYPYETLYENQGVCAEKSELLIFLLKEIGYKSAFFFNVFENHESVGIKCPSSVDFKNTGYCFIETTAPSIITDDEVEYVGVGGLYSNPEVIPASEGISLKGNIYEYKDAGDLKKIRNIININGQLSAFENKRLEELKEKYSLETI